MLHQYLAHFQDSLSLDCCVCIRALLGFSFVGLFCLYLAHFQDSLSLDCCVFILRTFKNPFHSTVPLVNRAPLRFSFTVLLHQYFALFQDFFFIGLLRLYLAHFQEFLFIRLLHQYLAHVLDSLSFDYYISISRAFRILYHWIVAFVSRALQDSLSFDYYISFSYTFRILFHWIVMFVSRALLGFSIIGLLRLYLAHFQDSLSFDYYISFSCTFRIPLHSIIT